MKKKILAVFATLAMSICVCMCCGTTAFAATDSGSCGDSLTWTFNSSTGVLKISGSGNMTSYPWQDYKNSISDIVFSGNVTSICNYAFSDCINIDSVTIPASVTEIGYSAFKDCKNLDSVKFGKNSNLVTLGSNSWNNSGVFQNCINLSEITLPDKLTGIHRYTFTGCSNLETVKIGKSVAFIGYRAFADCINLTDIVVPNSVESIGDEAFYNCGKLSSVKLGSKLQSIGNYAFQKCDAMTSIVIPASVTEIGYSAFKDLKKLSSVTFAANSNLSVLGSNSWNNSGVFQGCTALKTIVLPDKLNGIHRYTFAGCSNLQTVKIGKSVAFIGYRAFADCINLTGIVVPDSVESIDDEAFYNCGKLSSVKLGSKLQSIGNHAFQGCNPITSIVIPASVTEIGYSAFKDLKNLSSVTFAANSNLTTLGSSSWYNSGVFQGCTALKSVVLPDKLTTIQAYTFAGCTALQSAYVGKHVVSINYCAFSGCSALKTIVLPKVLTSIDRYAFENCSALNTVKYTGSQSRWNTLKDDGISVDGNGYLLNAPKFVYNYTGQILSITAQPTDASGKSGTEVSFKVAAKGDGLTYQWQLSDDQGQTWRNSSAKTAVYTVTLSSKNNGRYVRCVVKDSSGDTLTSNKAVMKTISTKLRIISQPEDTIAKKGTNFAFTIVAEGDDITYKWQLSDDNCLSWRTSSVTTPTYYTTLTEKNNHRCFQCILRDSHGNKVVSHTFSMEYLTIAITSHPASVTAKNGDLVTFKTKATGDGLTYQWQLSDDQGKTWRNSKATTASYSTTLTSTNNGRYLRCVVTDKYGNSVKSDAAYMKITSLAITGQPSNATGKKGDTVKFTVTAKGPGITWQWQLSDDQGKTWRNSSTKAATYSATLSDKNNGRFVRCLVTDKYGNAVKSKSASMKIK